MNAPNTKVLDSIHNEAQDLCVDFFVRTDGTYGFEEFRRDFEDGGNWHSLQRYSTLEYHSMDEALQQALSNVSWLPKQRQEQ